jgi:methionyl-tRNA formyltransferase
VRLIESGNVVTTLQDSALATPAPKIFKEDCRIRWEWTADRIRNFVRGLSPSPSAWTEFQGKVVKIFRVSVQGRPASGAAGGLDVTSTSLCVSTGDRIVSIEELQLEGRKRMSVEEFLRGYRPRKGESFE